MLEILFWNTLNILSSFVEWYIFDFVLRKTSNIKRARLIKNISFALLILIIVTFNFINMDSNLKLLLAMIMGFLFADFNYEVRWLKGIIVTLVYWMIFLGIDIISTSIVATMNSIYDLELLLTKSIFRLELIVISKLLLITLIPVFSKFELKEIQLNLKKRELLYMGIPIITNISSIITIFIYAFRQEQNNFIKNVFMFIMSALFLLSNISLIIIIYKIMKDSELRVENRIIKEKINMQYEYYSKLQKNHMKIRKLYHDIKNHMICIEEMYDDNESTREYINNINKEISSSEDIYKTGNMILDIILNEKKAICDKNNIDLFVDINLSKCGFIEPMDISSIFSNILENAIEACEKMDDGTINKYIKIRGTIVKNFFVLKAENSKTNEIFIKNNNIMTDKDDDFLHGIGINSIKNSVEKYNGEVAIDYTGYKFTINIYIPL